MTMSDDRDPLLERLRDLPPVILDDVTAARTLARAEAQLVATPARSSRPAAISWARAVVPAALTLWGLVYGWGAVHELAHVFTRSPRETTALMERPSPDSATSALRARPSQPEPALPLVAAVRRSPIF